jgi:gamma-glutamylcyclotransferase (GGCT)/AIG2-like uncharacterized protein YtfP
MAATGLSPELLARLAAVNARRRSAAVHESERTFEREFAAQEQLAVYGSLAPGRANAHELAGLDGRWTDGLVVHGDLVDGGWGAAIGYPALRWRADGPAVAVQLFRSTELAAHWKRLDEFEGAEYRRILVPLFRAGELFTVANLYEAASTEPARRP